MVVFSVLIAILEYNFPFIYSLPSFLFTILRPEFFLQVTCCIFLFFLQLTTSINLMKVFGIFFAFSWAPLPCGLAAALPRRPPCSKTHPIYRPVRWLAVALSISHLGVPLTSPTCPSTAEQQPAAEFIWGPIVKTALVLSYGSHPTCTLSILGC